MNIVACIKRVPVTETQPAVSPDKQKIDPASLKYMISFYDEIALEEAARTKEKLGGELTVLTIGPSDASKEMRECLAKGADKGVILVDPDWATRDARSTAKALAERIRALGANLVFTGRVATDRDNAAVGPMLATYLGWACVTDVVAVELTANGGHAKRESEAGIEEYAFSLPAVLTCQKDLNEPRYAGLKGIMGAKKKPLEEVPLVPEPSQEAVVELALPPARKGGRIVGEGAAAVPALIEALKSEAQLL
jgi:electron transfer flavoprotein beta subunit